MKFFDRGLGKFGENEFFDQAIGRFGENGIFDQGLGRFRNYRIMFNIKITCWRKIWGEKNGRPNHGWHKQQHLFNFKPECSKSVWHFLWENLQQKPCTKQHLHVCAHPHTRSHAHTLSCTHTHTLSHACTHTHTHTHTLSLTHRVKLDSKMWSTLCNYSTGISRNVLSQLIHTQHSNYTTARFISS